MTDQPDRLATVADTTPTTGLGRVLADMAVEAALAPWRFVTEGAEISPEAAALRPELLVDAWVFDPTLNYTLLVEHPRRGWVMPGGKVEPDELVREAARRELHEETGVLVSPDLLKAAAVGSGFDGPRPWFAIAFEVLVPMDTALTPERGRAVQWWSLDDSWLSVYPHDRERLIRHVSTRRPGTGS